MARVVLKSVHTEQYKLLCQKVLRNVLESATAVVLNKSRKCYSSSACPVYSDLLGHLSRNSCKLRGAPAMFESNLKATRMCTLGI